MIIKSSAGSPAPALLREINFFPLDCHYAGTSYFRVLSFIFADSIQVYNYVLDVTAI